MRADLQEPRVSSEKLRLTGTSFAVLTLLHHLGEATPYDLKQALERSIANFWPVPHTTFYAEPARLEQGGYLTVRQEPAGRKRKLYALTDSGRQALRSWADSPKVAQSQLRDEGTLKIFAGADPRVIFSQQREWRLRKLQELEGYLAAVEALPEDEHSVAIATTLRVGINYERMLLLAIDEYMEQNPADAQAAATDG